MLPRSRRLNLRKSFHWVKLGNKLENSLIKLLVRFGSNREPKVAITSAGAIFKSSSERNRARRLISAVFEDLYLELPRNINIVALPKRKVLELSSDQLFIDVRLLLNEILSSTTR